VTAEDDVGHEVEEAEAVSLAMLVVLETLSPVPTSRRVGPAGCGQRRALDT